VHHSTLMKGYLWNHRYHTACSATESCAQPMTVRRPMRLAVAMVTALGAVLPAACAYQGVGMPGVSAVTLRGEGALTEPSSTSLTDTYNPALAPVGARLSATMTPSGESTTATLTVAGLLPNRGYAAHAHLFRCNTTPEAAGPHYQNRIDPAATRQAPSTNPEYANPSNEVWLDVRTDATGSGTSRTTVPFVFTDRGPGSIVVHEAMQTAIEPGQAGKAGARIACLTLSAVQPNGVEPRGSR
jgi:superoxide dismutase, Cu-Zn family